MEGPFIDKFREAILEDFLPPLASSLVDVRIYVVVYVVVYVEFGFKIVDSRPGVNPS